MARESFRASAPGKLMLLGEHAVLHGHRCIVCAVNQRMNILVTPRNDSKINIDSELGQYQADLKNPFVDPTFRFVLSVIDQHKELLSHGFDLTIESEFDSTVGLGSSAAVTAAMTAAVFHLADMDLDPVKIFDHSLVTVRTVQGTGSGADLAASVFGGILLYRFHPNEIKPLKNIYPISVIYSGAKTPTTDVIQRVEQKREHYPQQFEHIYNAMDASAGQAADAINRNDWKTFGELLALNQGLMQAIGVSTKKLTDIAYALQVNPGILGAKISGSGLGDCVVGLGVLECGINYKVLPISMSHEGVTID
jgi:mevalonate kinase